MKLKHCFLLTAVVTSVTTGCVDDNYDLSDIDTTTRVEVRDLTIPVNIDAVTLSDILDLDDDSKIKSVTIDGKEFYAFTDDGTFDSDPIYIEKITASAPHLDPTTRTLAQIADENPGSPTTGESCTYEIVDMGNDFTYHAGEIDKSIIDVTSAGVDDIRFAIHLTTHDVEESAESETFTDLVIELPKGMTASPTHGKYDPVTGLWTIDRFDVDGTEADAWVDVTRVDLKANGVEIAPDHTLTFPGKFRVRSGLLTIVPKKVNGRPMELPQTLQFSAAYYLNDFVANSFSGIIEYDVEGLTIDPISLSDIPDFLNGDGTVLKIANPQIYLQLNNPVADNSLRYSAMLSMTAMQRDGVTQTEYKPTGSVNVGYDHGVTGPYNYVMAPSDKSLTIPDGFGQNLSYISFPTLCDILTAPAGSTVTGLPTEIKINVLDPQVPHQSVDDFILGRNIPGVNGKYNFMAPLALNDGSMIIYTDTQDGWNDEDVDAITITHLSASIDVTNLLPFDGELTAYPIDVNGNRIQGVEVKSSKIEAGTKDVPVTIEMTGTITHLDGVTFIARLNSANRDPLTPSETITLKNIRVKVSGYYEKEL